ncbi:MAG TPA: porin [Bacteroidota bacterium]|nr:porin [Bacteroidota bacterium]
METKRWILWAVFSFSLSLPSNVNSQPVIFGKMDADVQLVSTSRAEQGAAGSRMRLATNASRIGARGSMALGSGLEAVWQVATRVNLNGAETGGGGGLFTLMGNTRVGIKSNFGTVFLGIWDTPFRQVFDKIDLFDQSHIGSPIGMLGSIGNCIGGTGMLPATAQGFHPTVANVSVASTGFHRRQKSSVHYWSPLFQQIQLKVAYSMDDPANKTSIADPALFSSSISYDSEPVYLAAAYELHQDLKAVKGANVEGVDMGARLVCAYFRGAGKLGVIYELLSYHAPATGTTQRAAISVSGSCRFGNVNLGAVATHADALSGTNDTGADQYSLRAGYFLSDVVELFAQYTVIRNRTNGTYNFGDGLSLATAPGARISGFGMGIAYALQPG